MSETIAEKVIAEGDAWLNSHRVSETWRTMNRLRDQLVREASGPTTTEWAVRGKTTDGPYYLPADDEEDAQNILKLLNLSYPWPEENKVVRREVHEWVEA